jgi:hypothetical protein
MTCPDSSGKWESAVIDMLALDYYVGFALNKISCNINTAKRLCRASSPERDDVFVCYIDSAINMMI